MIFDEKDRYRMQNLADRYPGENPGYAALAKWIYENCRLEVVWLLEQMLIQAATPPTPPPGAETGEEEA